MLEENLANAEDAARPNLRPELQDVHTVPPSEAAVLQPTQNPGDAAHPWVVPETFQQQADLLRFQVDPKGETEFQRNIKQQEVQNHRALTEQGIGFKNKQLELERYKTDKQKEIVEMQLKSRMELAKMEQAFELKLAKERKNTVFTNGLVHHTWNKAQPADQHQAIAMVLDAIFEPSTRKIESITVMYFIMIVLLS